MRLCAVCPECGRMLRRVAKVPFVILRMECACGTDVFILNPRVSWEEAISLPRCLDCGHPIPPPICGHHSAYRNVLRTCPNCWTKHRLDEPGEDLGNYLLRRTKRLANSTATVTVSTGGNVPWRKSQMGGDNESDKTSVVPFDRRAGPGS